MRGETKLSTATVEAFLDSGLFKHVDLSLEVVDFVVLFMLNYLQSVKMTKTKCEELQAPSTRYIETNMQIGGRKAVEALTMPKPEGHLHPGKGTSLA